MGYIPVGMECFGAQNEEVSETIRKYCEGTDLVILLIAGRYGSITAEGISYTESEYKYFREHKIPVLVFIREDNSIRTSDWETNPESKEKLANFKKELRNNHTLAPDWTTSDDLIIKLQHSLNNMKLDKGWIRFDEKNYITPEETTIEHGMVVIKVRGSKEECENGQAKLMSFGSLLVDSPKKPVKYKDTMRADSGIFGYNFTPKFNVDKDRYERTSHRVLEYEISALDSKNKLACTGELLTHQELQKKKGGLAFPIPYHAKNLIVQIDITDAKFIRDYNVEANLKKLGVSPKQKPMHFNPLTWTYTIKVDEAPAESNIAFEWKNDEVQ